MADAPKTRSQLLGLFADNTTRNITAEQLRDFVDSAIFYAGVWTSGNSYLPNDMVKYNGGIYVCSATIAGTASPVTDTAHWSQISSGGVSGKIAIAAGSTTAIGSFGADNYYNSGGGTFSTTNTIDLSHVVNPAPMAVYQNEHYNGPLVYAIPTNNPGGSYLVRLHYSENYHDGSGQRIFTVGINGTTVETAFDIYAASGGQYTAVVKEYSVTADAGGQVVLTFTGISDNPKVDGIEIVLV